MSVVLLAVLIVAAASSWLLTAAVRRYALARAMLDVPSHRSAHRVPTPRGGGLAIAIVVLGGIVAGAVMGVVARSTAVAFVGGGIVVAAVGWVDDARARGLSAGARAAAHTLAALWALYWLGGLPTVVVAGATLHVGALGTVLAAVGIVWCVNLYNFMDGIDGLAGGEAVAVSIAGAALLLARGATGLALVALLIGGASIGFLALNWAPAKLFMGDVGSGLLGYLFAVLALASERAHAVPLVLWVVLLGVFVFDATVTLLRRMAAGQRWLDAHAEHAYQRAVRTGRSHARVVGAVLALNALLALAATAALLRPALTPIAVLGAAAVLTAAYRRVGRELPMFGGVAPSSGPATGCGRPARSSERPSPRQPGPS